MNVFLEDLMKSPREPESMVLALEFGYLPGEVMASHRTDNKKWGWRLWGMFFLI